jgi:putative ABC transport system permease protein
MEHVLRDVRYVLRTTARSPLFSFIVVLILILGIAANCAIFSIIQHSLLNPLKCESPQRLMVLENALLYLDGRPSPGSSTLDWGNLLQSFENLAAYRVSDGGLNLSGYGGAEEPERVEGVGVSASFFHIFRTNVTLGRTFVSEEEYPGRNRVVVLSHSLWQRRFGADGGVIGKTIRLNEVTYTVIGVTPPEFSFPRGADLWLPASLGEGRVFTASGVHNILGRLKHGVSATQAQLEVNALRQRFKQENPASWIATREIRIVPLLEKVIGSVRLSMLLLWGAVGFVQLIVCANVANLMLNRGLARRKEMAVRAALGASNRALFCQSLTESLALSLIAGVAGLIGARWFLKLIVIYMPASVTFLGDVKLDNYAVAFTVGISLATGILVGLAPGFQATRIDLDQTLKEGQRQGSESSRLSRLRSLLIVFEVALALVLLIGAGLLIGSFKHVLKIESGMNAANVLTVAISLPKAKYTDPGRAAQFFNDLISQLRGYPPIRSIGAINVLPMGKGEPIGTLFEIVGRPKTGKFQEMFANDLAVTPDYFSAIGIPLIEGRYFTEHDRPDTKRVVIINRSFAKRFWPSESPVGKQLQIAGNDAPAEIVGVVGDVKHFGLEGKTMFEMYSTYLQSTTRLTTLVIKTESDPLQYAAAVRKEVQALDPNLPVYDIKTMEQRIDESTGNRRFITFVLGIFAIIAVILSGAGIYSVMAYSVSQRTHEIGIRIALGADRGQILGLVIGKAMLLTSLGAVIGIASATLLTRLMAGLLYGLQATDILTFSVTTLGLFTITFVASFVPAYRATRIDPLVALRYE